MESKLQLAYRATRRQYELARVSVALRHAVLVALVVACSAKFIFGWSALQWLPITVLAITFSEWRGEYWMTGARRGLLAGLVSLLLPLSILRPCCGLNADPGAMSCCTAPWACWASGAVFGLALALFVPQAPDGRKLQAAVGTLLGVLAVAVTRCSTLFLGETLGLLGGIAAATLATSLARSWWDSPSSRGAS